MVEAAAVESVILKTLETLNGELSDDKKIKVTPDTVLFGVNAELDSLSLVSFVVEIEAAVNSAFGLDVSLADERAMNRSVLPFTNVQTLKSYILELANEASLTGQ